MEEHPNVALWREAEQAFSRGDMTTVQRFWSGDVVYHFAGDNPLAGDHKGKDAVLAVFAKMGELTEGTLHIEVHDVLANDDHVVALVRLSASRKGKQQTWNGINVYHVQNGKIAEVWIHSTDQQIVDRFLS